MFRLLTTLALCTIRATAQPTPMALKQARYEIQSGAPSPLSASSDTLEFLLKATKLTVVPAVGLVVGPNRAGNQVMIAASLRSKPGEYSVTLSATSATGEQR